MGGDDDLLMEYFGALDFSEIEDCEKAAEFLFYSIAANHGSPVADHIFSRLHLSKTDVKEAKNVQLLVMYLHSGLDSPEFARDVVALNKQLPAWYREGPLGSTDSTAMVRQVNRLITKMNRNPGFMEMVREVGGFGPGPLLRRDKSKS
jgi:hypothetical protein